MKTRQTTAARWQTECPTPRKLRYPTKHAARTVANTRGRSIGVGLYTYYCKCGSYHLTRQRQEVSEVPDVEVHGLGHILGMDDDAFINVVTAEVMGNLDDVEREFLRLPQVVPRWKDALVMLRRRVESQLTAIRKLKKPSAEDDEWRTMLVEMVSAIDERQQECGDLWKALPRLPSTHKISRRTAGDRATETLVNRHLKEFIEIYRAEAERVGLTATPNSVLQDGISAELLRELRETHPQGVDPTVHVPRFPDVHLVLTGDESFDEAANLALGVIYQHLRNEVEGPAAAARVMRDLAVQVERLSDQSLTGLLWVVHDWITVHV